MNLRNGVGTSSLFSFVVTALLLLVVVALAFASDQDPQQVQPSSWKWQPEAPHLCTVDRMTTTQVLEKFGPEGVPALYPTPLVITTNNTTKNTNAITRQRVAEHSILSSFPANFNVTLSSSNSFSQHRRTIPLETYLEEMKLNGGVTDPHQLSNESWYLFGETYGDEWKHLLRDYQLPPCQTCHADYVALSFGIGNRGSGVQWHIHGPGFSESLIGRKHWVLYPPPYQPPFFHHDQSTRNWMEYIYTNTTKLTEYAHEQVKDDRDDSYIKAILDNSGRPYECTLEPGEMIYFPDRWHHATINCDPYTAFVSSFTSDFQYLQDQKLKQNRMGVFEKEL